MSLFHSVHFGDLSPGVLLYQTSAPAIATRHSVLGVNCTVETYRPICLVYYNHVHSHLVQKGPKAVFRPSENECKSENFLWCFPFILWSFSLSLRVNRPLELNYSKQLEKGQEEAAYQLQSCQVLLPPKILLHMWPKGSKAIVGVHTYVHKWITHSYKPSWKINKSIAQGDR